MESCLGIPTIQAFATDRSFQGVFSHELNVDTHHTAHSLHAPKGAMLMPIQPLQNLNWKWFALVIDYEGNCESLRHATFGNVKERTYLLRIHIPINLLISPAPLGIFQILVLIRLFRRFVVILPLTLIKSRNGPAWVGHLRISTLDV